MKDLINLILSSVFKDEEKEPKERGYWKRISMNCLVDHKRIKPKLAVTASC
jgi:hypothetical protein